MYWALLIVGILATAVFLVLRVQRGGIAALYAKAVASLCFIATAIAATNENRLFLDFGSWMTFGLVFGLLGDVWLDLKWIYLQDKDSYLYSGFIFFLLGHVCFVTAVFKVGPYTPASLIVAFAAALVIALVAILMEKLLKMHYGKFKWIVFLYSFMLALTMTMSMTLAVITGFEKMWTVMSVGGLLFLLSDLVLSGMYFGEGKNTSFNVILNHTLYYGNFTVGKILSAVVVFVVCYLILRVLMRLFTRILSRVNMDETLRKILLAAIKLILYFLLAMVVIDTLGVSVTSLLATFSVVGLAASLAVQDSLSNLASGIMLLVTKPFKIGDYVEIDDVSGTVKMISLIHTRITTIDNKMIYVPNSKIIATKIVNYTQQEKRRVDLEISASYDAPIETVRQSLLEAVSAVGLFSDTPAPPFAAVLSFDESSIRYVVRAWVKTEQYWDAYFALLEQIKIAFDQNGVEMTYNHLNVHMVKE